jgi:hypothetical protein
MYAPQVAQAFKHDLAAYSGASFHSHTGQKIRWFSMVAMLIVFQDAFDSYTGNLFFRTGVQKKNPVGVVLAALSSFLWHCIFC